MEPISLGNYGLLDRLLGIINRPQADVDYAIAVYLATHLRDIQQITVYDLMDSSFASRSSIRRFCQRLGYSSFSALKRDFALVAFPSDLRHRDTASLSLERYRTELMQGMQAAIEEVEYLVSDEDIANLADDIHWSDNVLLFAANDVSSNLSRFQQELLYTGKVVRFAVNATDSDIFGATPEEAKNALLVCVSASGRFAHESLDVVEGLTCRKVLVTATVRGVFEGHYDQIVYLSERGMALDRLGIFAKYVTTYFFDLLSEDYLNRYSTPHRPEVD